MQEDEVSSQPAKLLAISLAEHCQQATPNVVSALTMMSLAVMIGAESGYVPLMVSAVFR
jgi:hypothetical protein